MRTYQLALTIAIAALLITPTAHADVQGMFLPGMAQTSNYPIVGEHEVDVLGDYQIDTGHAYSLVGTYGDFVQPEVEVGGNVGIFGGDHTERRRYVGGIANFHLLQKDAISPSSACVPYIGIFAGFATKDTTAFSVGGQTGIKYFINQNSAVVGELLYRTVSGTDSIAELDFGFCGFWR